MADLQDVAKALNVEIKSKAVKEKEHGKRRRGWLVDEAPAKAPVEKAVINQPAPVALPKAALKPVATVSSSSLPPRNPAEPPVIKPAKLVLEAFVWPKLEIEKN
jgi:hypothetical protein